jgi:hypothetical protein
LALGWTSTQRRRRGIWRLNPELSGGRLIVHHAGLAAQRDSRRARAGRSSGCRRSSGCCPSGCCPSGSPSLHRLVSLANVADYAEVFRLRPPLLVEDILKLDRDLLAAPVFPVKLNQQRQCGILDVRVLGVPGEVIQSCIGPLELILLLPLSDLAILGDHPRDRVQPRSQAPCESRRPFSTHEVASALDFA